MTHKYVISTMRNALVLMLLAACATVARGEEEVTVHGSIQADILFPESDPLIGAEAEGKVNANVYANAGVFSKYVDAGLRFEYLQYPLPGFSPNFKGWGVPNIYIKGKYKGFEVTAGDFYEQFGSGFILRTYEERSLGIDNSIRGGRLKVNAIPGVRLTALGGVQRHFWSWNTKSGLLGVDGEWDMSTTFKGLEKRGITWTFGASYVMKHEDETEIIVPGTNYRLNLPTNVGAFDVRTSFHKGGFGLLLEYAWKSQDPEFVNNYTYGTGSAFMVSASYSKTGLSALIQVKRSDNMDWRSRRSEAEAVAFINTLPPFTYQHTYSLAAMYPYATQSAPGEWAFQGAFSYKFPRGTAMGGKYGTKFNINASYICGIDRQAASNGLPGATDTLMGTDWWVPGTSKLGQTYYTDINVQLDKRVTRDFQLNAMYMFQKYNQLVIEGHGEMINSHIIVAEGKWKINKKFTLRMEGQYLHTQQDKKDWLYGLAEISFAPYLMFAVSDQWNFGGDGTHYYMVTLTGNFYNNRLLIGYGRTRAGYNCAGGVCRYVPATRGFQISYNYNF